MAPHPEARTQLARLLGVAPSLLAEPDATYQAVDEAFGRLVEGLLAEAAASDDVLDRESAFAFLNNRLDSLGALLEPEQRSRLLQALGEKIEAW